MPGNFLMAEDYGRLLCEFAADVAPSSASSSPKYYDGTPDPLRLRPVADFAPCFEKILRVATEVPIEWQLGAYWAAKGTDLLTVRALNSANIGEALEVSRQHQGVLTNARNFSHRSTGGGELAEIHHGEHSDDPIMRLLFRSIVAAKLVHFFNVYAGSEKQHQVDLRASSFGSLMQRFDRELAFIDIEFSESEIILGFSPELVGYKLGDRDERLITALDRELNLKAAGLPLSGRWKDRIKYHIRSNHLSEVSLDEICDTFRVQRRTLARLLRDEGTTFTNILTDLRREKALHLVLHTGVPLKRVASELGFNSDASFNMAFKSWTGTTPMKFRKSAALRPPAGHPQPVELALAVEPRRSLRSGLLLSSWSTRADA